MLLDNKTKTEDNEHFKVFDFLANYIEKGKLDIVTGYFSVSAIARMKDKINDPEKFRMVLGSLLQTKTKKVTAVTSQVYPHINYQYFLQEF